MGASGNTSSLCRKAAMRMLAREFHDEYIALYRHEIHKEVGDDRASERVQKRARQKAWTRLRRNHEPDYQKYFVFAKNNMSDVDPKLRMQAWQRASKRLQLAEQHDFNRFLPIDGVSWEERRVRALVRLRKKHPGLFDRYLKEELDRLLDGA